MAIFNSKEYTQRYDAGQSAINYGNWRTAYDCFMDCLEYLKYYEPYRTDEIAKLEKLVKDCDAMF